MARRPLTEEEWAEIEKKQSQENLDRLRYLKCQEILLNMPDLQNDDSRDIECFGYERCEVRFRDVGEPAKNWTVFAFIHGGVIFEVCEGDDGHVAERRFVPYDRIAQIIEKRIS